MAASAVDEAGGAGGTFSHHPRNSFTAFGGESVGHGQIPLPVGRFAVGKHAALREPGNLLGHFVSGLERSAGCDNAIS